MAIFENLDLQDLENEIWKDILDYEGDYQVSNFGRIKSLKFRKERILKQNKNGEYFFIDLWKNGEKKFKLVHRLVYEAHIGKLEEGYDAHHINGDEEDNFVENLESKEHSKHLRDHNIGKHFSEEHKKKLSKNHANFKGENHYFYGKHHSEKTKIKISRYKKGENNPNYGKGISNQKIIDIQSDIKEGILTQIEISKKYNISQSTVSNIKNNKLRS